MIAVIEFGMGNIGSIVNMLYRIGVDAEIARDPATVRQADRLILPGVGAFDHGMTRLEASGLLPAVNEAVFTHRKPVLGICLGMQLMTRRSDEGQRPGLGWVAADTRRFDPVRTIQCGLKVPHMGWNVIRPAPGSRLFAGWEGEARFYFVHSFHAVCDRPGLVSATARHGYDITAAFEQDHLFGVQFHPEKSHRFGMRLLERFAVI